MRDRKAEVDDFLAEAGWALAARTPIAGDMSSRRYYRLQKNSMTAILMDATSSMKSFCAITQWLQHASLSAPRIFNSRAEAGLLLMEDFGNASLKAKLAAEPAFEDEAFNLCISLLLKVRELTPPCLNAPTSKELVAWTELVDDHYPGFKPGGLDRFRDVLVQSLESALEQDTCVSLRDFHSENIMWLPRRVGINKLGLLDYQDAFLTHPAYDLVSLLTDARTWIPKELRSRVIERYLVKSKDDRRSFLIAFDAFSVQRNLRILGIFTRARRHLDCLPNTYRYLMEALENPVFSGFREDILHAVPAPKGL